MYAHFPIFATHFPSGLTEDRLERLVERYMDHADHCLMTDPECSQADYDTWVLALNVWVHEMLMFWLSY